ncbi:peroxiredoxin-like 2C isoform X2 [Ovis aries]|uniref:peroxiredoxin-like 2C isoform X2 n=1 Tax=Ovis aries TaxID=9940 RepID=UPI001C2EA433|nr:peroxiredoxin-like 2C isoform X2 [Ovis aries]
MADPSEAPVTRQVSGHAAPAPVPSGPASWQPLAAAVAELPVLDASGRPVPFGELFRERRAIVVFVRHFLCYICKEYVEDLAKIPKSFLQEANVTLIVIGQSSYHHIEPFCKLTGYSHEIYVDPEREIYKRLGMKRGEEIASSVCFKCPMTVEQPTLSSLETSHVVVRRSALMISVGCRQLLMAGHYVPHLQGSCLLCKTS